MTTVVKCIITTNLVQNSLDVHNVQGSVPAKCAAKDAIKKAFTVYENVVHLTALYHQFMMSSRRSLGSSEV